MKREDIQSHIERIKIYITIKDLYLRFRKRFLFFFQVSFSWYCISREKETTYIELDCCCFLIIHFFTKGLLSSFHKAVSPLDLRIGMAAFQLPLGISKFFLILKLTPVWRNYTNSQHSWKINSPKQEYGVPPHGPISANIFKIQFSIWGFKKRVLQLAYICSHMQNLRVMPFFCFSFKPQNPDALCKLYTEIRWAFSQYQLT